MRTIKYYLLRLQVNWRSYWKQLQYNTAYKDLTTEELQIIERVESLAKQHPGCIRFDYISGETLLVLDTLLVTIKGNRINLDNHQGFSHINVPDKAADRLLTVIRIEAHRNRRALKHQVKLNLREFVNKIVV